MSCHICMHLAEVKDDEDLPPNRSLICHCGRHAKSRMHGFCIPDAIGRCPCVRQRRQCTKRCRFFNCRNNARTPDGCRCGVGERNIRSACTDVPGQRRSKCPCYTSGSSCSAEKCKCKGCGNSFGKRTAGKKDVKKERSTKCTSSPSPLKRKRTMDFLKESNSFISLGSWTNIETCLLDAVESFLHCTCFLPTKENLTHLYNYVVNSRFARQHQLHVSEKTKKQVEGKLNNKK